MYLYILILNNLFRISDLCFVSTYSLQRCSKTLYDEQSEKTLYDEQSEKTLYDEQSETSHMLSDHETKYTRWRKRSRRL